MELLKINMDEIVAKINEAPSEDKAKAIVEAVEQIANQHYADVIAQYQAQAVEAAATKQNVEKFGLRNLTAAEKSFYDKLAKNAFTGANIDAIPETTTEYVFEDLKKAHPLFQYVQWAPAGMKKWILSERSGKAVWGTLSATITEQIAAEIKSINMDVYKISAFLYIPQGIVKLGYEWIDRFVRTCLEESLSEGMEYGIVAEDGKEGPVGLLYDLEGAVVNGVYTTKTPVAITDLGPDSFGEDVLPILNRSGARTVDKIVIIANQQDLDTKIYKATHAKGFLGYQAADLYKTFVFVPSEHLTAGTAIAYLPNKFVAGISDSGVDNSKDYKFLEELITYKVVSHGNGRLIANDDAVVMDISGLEPLVPLINNIDITPAA